MIRNGENISNINFCVNHILPMVVNRVFGNFLDSSVKLGNDIEQDEKVIIIMKPLVS
jgi:hypothetical protein